MKEIDTWLDEYGQSHQNRVNKMIHWVCVPLIMLSLIGLLSELRISEHAIAIGVGSGSDLSGYSGLFFYLDLGTVLILLAFVYYLRMSVPMAVGMLAVAILLRLGCDIVSDLFGDRDRAAFIVIFVAAWVGQFIGHRIEGKKPSFVQDIQFLLIGPAWLLSFIYKRLGVRY